MKIILVIFWVFRPETIHFEARFGILVKNYTIWTTDQRNRSYLDSFRGHLSIWGAPLHARRQHRLLAKSLHDNLTGFPGAEPTPHLQPYLTVEAHGRAMSNPSDMSNKNQNHRGSDPMKGKCSPGGKLARNGSR